MGFARQYGVDRPDGRQLSFKASQADFADILGATRQGVNMTLHRFRDEGLIRTSYSTIAVVDFDRLCERAGIDKETGRSAKLEWPPLASTMRDHRAEDPGDA